MWLLEAIEGLAYKKMAPAQEDAGAYAFQGKVSNNFADNQTFGEENTDETFRQMHDEWDEAIAREETAYHSQWTATTTAIMTTETPPTTAEEAQSCERVTTLPPGHPLAPPTASTMIAAELAPVTAVEAEYTAEPIAIAPPPIYYNFPITVIEGIMDNPSAAFRRMLAWATYEKMKSVTWTSGIKRLDSAIEDLDYICEENKTEWYHFCGNTYSQYRGPRVGVSHKMFFKAWDRFLWWSDTSKILFLAFLAAKSIVGAKPYARTCDLQMCARMNGRASTYVSKDEMKEQSHPTILAHFTRKKWPKRREWLEQEYSVATYSRPYIRGYYVSNKMPLQKLAVAVERKLKSKPKNYAERMAEAGDKARRMLEERQNE